MEEITNMNEKLAEIESFLDEVYTICTERTFDECSAIYNKLSNVTQTIKSFSIVYEARKEWHKESWFLGTVPNSPAAWTHTNDSDSNEVQTYTYNNDSNGIQYQQVVTDEKTVRGNISTNKTEGNLSVWVYGDGEPEAWPARQGYLMDKFRQLANDSDSNDPDDRPVWQYVLEYDQHIMSKNGHRKIMSAISFIRAIQSLGYHVYITGKADGTGKIPGIQFPYGDSPLIIKLSEFGKNRTRNTIKLNCTIRELIRKKGNTIQDLIKEKKLTKTYYKYALHTEMPIDRMLHILNLDVIECQLTAIKKTCVQDALLQDCVIVGDLDFIDVFSGHTVYIRSGESPIRMTYDGMLAQMKKLRVLHGYGYTVLAERVGVPFPALVKMMHYYKPMEAAVFVSILQGFHCDLYIRTDQSTSVEDPISIKLTLPAETGLEALRKQLWDIIRELSAHFNITRIQLAAGIRQSRFFACRASNYPLRLSIFFAILDFFGCTLVIVEEGCSDQALPDTGICSTDIAGEEDS